MRDFKKLKIWQHGMRIVSSVYKVAKFFPAEEKYGMRSQTTRCAVSIPTNIAEGSAKKSQKEYQYYIETSLGSSFELETNLLIVQEQGWFPDEVISELLTMTIEEQRMLSAFIKRL
jgi:four helix bundle protein